MSTSSVFLYFRQNIGEEQKKVGTSPDVLYFSAGSEIPGQEGVIFQGVFNFPPVGNQGVKFIK